MPNISRSRETWRLRCYRGDFDFMRSWDVGPDEAPKVMDRAAAQAALSSGALGASNSSALESMHRALRYQAGGVGLAVPGERRLDDLLRAVGRGQLVALQERPGAFGAQVLLSPIVEDVEAAALPWLPREKKSARRTAAAQWSLKYDDGSTVYGVGSTYEGPPEPREFKGSTGEVAELALHDTYSVAIVGTTQLKLAVTDAEGQPIEGARVRIERAFGPTVELTTDAGGQIVLEGCVGQEPYEATVIESPIAAQGKFVDDQNRPLPGVRARLVTDSGRRVEATSAADGTFRVTGLLPGEGYALEVLEAQLP